MELKEILKMKSIKITNGRIEILNILLNSKTSLSAERIYQIFRDNKININLSTIYRTLELFEEKELTEKIILEDGVFSYKIKKKTHRHYLECDVCHKEVEIPCPMSQIEEFVQNKTGFTLTNHNLVMRGICKECKKNNKENK